VLQTKRFKIEVCGKPVRLTHAVEPRWREHLFGPFGTRFQINIKVRARMRRGFDRRHAVALLYTYDTMYRLPQRAPR